jgi:hypothetical protein
MFIIVCLALTLLGTTCRIARRRREQRHAAFEPLGQAFPLRDMRELDAELEEIARCERHRLDRELERYLTGAVGYVVGIHSSQAGIALQLSDGRRLAMTGVSRRALPLLVVRTAEDLLQPTHVHRDTLSCRLRLRGWGGAELDIYARSIAIATVHL